MHQHQTFVAKAAVAVLAEQADALNLTGLDLRYADELASLGPLRGLQLTHLRFGHADPIASLEALTACR